MPEQIYKYALFRVEAPSFCAGAILKNHRVIKCAPKLRRHFAGKTLDEIIEISRRNRRWRTNIIWIK